MVKLLSVADVISLINAIFGFLAVLILLSNLIPNQELRIRVSFSFILLAILADGLDGIVARKIKNSDIGGYLDSMADLTSMSIATSVFLYVTYYGSSQCLCIYNQIYLLIALVLFLSAGIIRLASFHIMKNEKYFVGFPVPASAIILLMLAFQQVELIIILPAIVIISIAMISPIHFPKPGLKIDIIAAVLILSILIVYSYFHYIIPILLLIAMLAYAIGGSIYLTIKK
jgi:CDP-diacylglycerol--serine O-phosphatidyltransferase